MPCLTEASLYTPQLHITVSPDKVKINVDCQEVAERPVKAANNITLDGYEVLGKMVKSGGGRRQSATVSERKSMRLETASRHFPERSASKTAPAAESELLPQRRNPTCFSPPAVSVGYIFLMNGSSTYGPPLLLLCSSSSRCSILSAA